MKLLYVSAVDFTNEKSSGVCRKIKTQIKTFEKAGLHTSLTYYKNNRFYILEDNKENEIGSNKLKQISSHFHLWRNVDYSVYDAIFIRYNYCDPFFIGALKKMKAAGCKVVIEIPTYPYDEELKNASNYSKLLVMGVYYLDIWNREKMRKNVDLIVSYSGHKEIFGIPCKQIVNGADFESLQLVKSQEVDQACIRLIAVAALADWHGYDRVIRGLGAYYKNGGKRNILFHIVGDGAVANQYRELIKANHLEEHVIMHGKRFGSELDEIYEDADIAVSSLGLHRIGITGSWSVLKSREYSAKGLPMITSCEIDVFPSEKTDFVLKYPEDDSPIDISALIDFYDKIYMNGKQEIKHRIRNEGMKICDMPVVLKPIIDFYLQ